MIRGRAFIEIIRIQARKSEFQAESRSYRPKVRVAAAQTHRIRTESPRKGPQMGFRCFYWENPLRAFLNPPKLWCLKKRCSLSHTHKRPQNHLKSLRRPNGLAWVATPFYLHLLTLWHEIITKIIPRELFLGILMEFAPSKFGGA